MFDFDPPSDKPSILAVLETLDHEIGDYFEALSLDEFLAPQGDAWSPEGHLRHLTKAVAAVAGGMRVPRLLLGLRFGRARRGSRDFEEIRELYLQALGDGLKAGRYGPSSRPDELPPEARRGRTLGRWRRAGGELRTVVRGWPERDLDRYRLPHPGIGKLTAREMLFFTVYHNAHHARRVHQRRTEGAER